MVVPLGRFSIWITVASLLDVVDAALEGFAIRGAARILVVDFVAAAFGFDRT